MYQIRIGLEDKLPIEKIKEYANPKRSTKMMQEMRLKITNDKESETNQEYPDIDDIDKYSNNNETQNDKKDKQAFKHEDR